MITDLTGPEGSSGAEDAKPSGRHHKNDDGKPPPTGAPTVTEWQDFFGKIVLRALTEGYLNLVLFRVVDESELTERERKLITLSREDLKDMASPLASFAYKNKHARKHGRAIIAAAESYETVVDLLIWMRRVNKIARKYRKPETQQPEGVSSGTISQEDSGSRTGTIVVNRGTG